MKLSALLLTAFLLAPVSVFAHATPVTYTPESSVSVPVVPPEVVIRFSERVEEKTSSIRVLGPDGERVDTGVPSRDAADPRTFRTAMQYSGTGTYTVLWQVISADDGHFTKGAYTFAVGTPVSSDDSPRFEMVHSSASREAAAVGFEMVGHAMMLGMLAVLLLIGRKKLPVPQAPARRAVLFTCVSLLLSVGGAAAYLLLKAYDLSWAQDVTFADALRQFLTTVAGSAAVTRAVLALAFFTLFLSVRHRTHRGLPLLVLLVPVVAMMYLRARVSHAAASEWMPGLAVAMNFAHLFAKSLWAGGLAALVFLVLPSLSKHDFRHFAQTSFMSSKLLSVVFGAVGVTGLFVIWLHLKDPANVWNSLWGSRFLYLSAFATVLVALRVYHHLILDARLARGVARGPVSVAGLTLHVEMLMSVIVLLWSGAMVITTPPLGHAPVTLGSAESQGLQLSIGEYPYDPTLLALHAEGASSALAAIRDVTLTLTQESEGIGPIVVPLERRSAGGFVFPLSAFSVPGVWTLDATVQRADAYDAVARFRIDHPVQLQNALKHASEKSIGLFEIVMLVLAVGAVGISVLLWIIAARRERTLHHLPELPLPLLRFGTLWAPSLTAAFLLFMAAGFHVQYFHGAFRDACKAGGFYWHENVPMREGRVTSNTARLGCMMGFGKGMFHMGDFREFTWFGRPEIAIASLATDPVLTAGTPTTFTVSIRDGQHNPLPDLVAAHDRYLHVVVIGEDFTVFRHVHAEGDIAEMLRTGDFPVPFTFPKAGRYIIALDYTARNHEFSQEFYVQVAGAPVMTDPVVPAALTQHAGDLDVRFLAPRTIRPGGVIRVAYEFTKDGQPVKDLQPYLAAPMHIAVVREDLRNFVHAHGQLPRSLWKRLTDLNPPSHVHTSLPDRFGNVVESTIRFTQPGRYILFAEFRHDGKTLIAPFSVQVR